MISCPICNDTGVVEHNKTLTCVCACGDAFRNGKDCGRNGANTRNCHIRYFDTPEKAKAWEYGKLIGNKKRLLIDEWPRCPICGAKLDYCPYCEKHYQPNDDNDDNDDKFNMRSKTSCQEFSLKKEVEE